jgi:tRNA(fMet)-specific endonuclease VapC
MVVVLDTNHFTELVLGSNLGKRLSKRIEVEEADPFSCIVAAEESLQGWIAFVRRHQPGNEQVEGYSRLQSCLQALAKMTIFPFDREAAEVFHHLQALHRRVGTMDLKIAAICILHEATLLTRNIGDFDGLNGLRVENWLD